MHFSTSIKSPEKRQYNYTEHLQKYCTLYCEVKTIKETTPLSNDSGKEKLPVFKGRNLQQSQAYGGAAICVTTCRLGEVYGTKDTCLSVTLQCLEYISVKSDCVSSWNVSYGGIFSVDMTQIEGRVTQICQCRFTFKVPQTKIKAEKSAFSLQSLHIQMEQTAGEKTHRRLSHSSLAFESHNLSKQVKRGCFYDDSWNFFIWPKLLVWVMFLFLNVYSYPLVFCLFNSVSFYQRVHKKEKRKHKLSNWN